MTDDQKLGFIAGFWRRIAAFIIDTLFLGVSGYIIGLGLESKFVELGCWGRLVGFIIALIYFGVLNSKVTNGQTPGKKILKLRVVNAKNNPIGILQSFVRYSVIGIPFFLNGAQLTANSLTSLWLYPISLIVFGGLLSAIYLYLFNRVTRQSLHDLISGTYVVSCTADPKEFGQVWKPHLIVVLIILIAAAIVPFFTRSLSGSEPFKDMLSAQTSIMEDPIVSYATLQSGNNTINGKSNLYVNATVYLKKNTITDEVLAKKIAIAAMSKFSNSAKIEVIQINLVYGYDIGITSKWRSQAHSFNPNELVTHE